MNNIIDDINIKSLKQLITPIELMENIPVTKESVKTVQNTREQARRIIHGQDDRLLVIIGPCSIHNTKAAIEYGQLLKEYIDKLQEKLCIIMRTYFEKPRTSIGWKGLINDPHLDGSFDINQGLKIARQLLVDLNNMGVPIGIECLDTIIPQYLSDLTSWGAIGARTTESQVHRELASGLSMPIGFKNGTNGNIDIAIDAIHATSFSHHFLGVTKSARAAIISTRGNDACHIILRGAKDHTNYDKNSIEKAVMELKRHDLYPHVMVDCSHGNSRKRYENQIVVGNDLCRQISVGSKSIFGVMLESHLTSGKQPFAVGQKPRYNQSITDSCLSWQETKPILDNLSQAVKTRRGK